MDVLNEQLALAETAPQEARLEELDIEGVLAFAAEILARPSRFWVEASLDQRRRLQRALFLGDLFGGACLLTTALALIRCRWGGRGRAAVPRSRAG